MASHGRSGVPRWFLGSVAEAVLRRSPAPVLLVKSAPAASGGAASAADEADDSW
jgi:hypothetical protein